MKREEFDELVDQYGENIIETSNKREVMLELRAFAAKLGFEVEVDPPRLGDKVVYAVDGQIAAHEWRERAENPSIVTLVPTAADLLYALTRQVGDHADTWYTHVDRLRVVARASYTDEPS